MTVKTHKMLWWELPLVFVSALAIGTGSGAVMLRNLVGYLRTYDLLAVAAIGLLFAIAATLC